jgi:GntR family transcriptional regulator
MLPGMQLDPEDSTPLYVQLADALRQQIRSGEIPPRRALPSKLRLEQELGVSSKTIDAALELLKADGLVETVRGKGIYVTERKRWKKSG